MMRCWGRDISDRPNFEGLYQALRPHVNQWAATAGIRAALAFPQRRVGPSLKSWVTRGQKHYCESQSPSAEMKTLPALVFLVLREPILSSERWKRQSQFHLDKRLFFCLFDKLIHFKLLWMFILCVCFIIRCFSPRALLTFAFFLFLCFKLDRLFSLAISCSPCGFYYSCKALSMSLRQSCPYINPHWSSSWGQKL